MCEKIIIIIILTSQKATCIEGCVVFLFLELIFILVFLEDQGPKLNIEHLLVSLLMSLAWDGVVGNFLY